MNSLFLSPAELVDLTGFKMRAGQARWLDQNRWRYAMARNQQPRVARDYFLQRMGALPGGTSATALATAEASMEQPNFAALNRRR